MAAPDTSAPDIPDTSAPDIPALSPNDGTAIPQLGYGTWQVKQPHAAETVGEALRAGYRHLDTAAAYGNERGVGEAVAASGLDRAEVFLTSKLANDAHAPDDARRAFDTTLADLGTDHVDLYLIHWPLPTRYGGDFVSTWRVLEEFKADGRARSIGVSNFRAQDLDKLAAACDEPPAVNQIEAHPYFPNDDLRAACEDRGILVEAWSPLARGGELLDDPVVREVADRQKKTPAQVVLRWHVERGDVIFPKSSDPARMRENLAIFDFALPDADMADLNALDRGGAGRVGPNPDTFAG